MEDLQERYDELETIIDTLDDLIDNITDEDFIEQLRETKYQAENEKEEIEPRLQELRDREEREQNLEYERMKL